MKDLWLKTADMHYEASLRAAAGLIRRKRSERFMWVALFLWAEADA